MTRVITPEHLHDDKLSLRPSYLREFIGQDHVKNNLEIFIQAAKKRGDPLDHVLLQGPPGLGKTTLANIISREMAVNFKPTVGPLLKKTGDLAAILTQIQEHDILFIDEIHRLSKNIEELLYPAMEDYHLDLIVGEGIGARMMRINIPRFTLVGATTQMGLLSGPLRDRFGIIFHLEFYTNDELVAVIVCGAKTLGIDIERDGAYEIARRSRRTPRIALRLLRRVWDFCQVQNKSTINYELAIFALDQLKIDAMGLDESDYNYLRFIASSNSAVGIEAIAAALFEQARTLEDAIEPYLIQIGFLSRTSRGRILTEKGMDYLRKNNR